MVVLYLLRALPIHSFEWLVEKVYYECESVVARYVFVLVEKLVCPEIG